MTNYREILRLHSLGPNKTEIAASLHCARNTVAATLQRASNCGLQWPLPTNSWQIFCFPALLGSRYTRCRTMPMCTRKCRKTV